jgi:GNAT superfamily N-acetyltransferase
MPTLRPYDPADEDAVVALAVRAWAPVFASMERVLAGSGVYEAFYPDWEAAQAEAVRSALRDDGMHVLVAEAGGAPAGFVAARLLRDDDMGEIHMVAVDPAVQRQGIGAALTAAATDWIAAAGVRIAMVETGGDPGHGPARATYAAAGYTAMEVVRYFKRL